MTTDRIKEIQEATAYPDSVSVQQALLQVWNECEQSKSEQTKEWKKHFIIDGEKSLEAFMEWRKSPKTYTQEEMDKAKHEAFDKGWKAYGESL